MVMDQTFKNVWVNFIVPQTEMDFVEPVWCVSFRIDNNKNQKIFNKNPLADLKYQSRTDREMRQLIKDKELEKE